MIQALVAQSYYAALEDRPDDAAQYMINAGQIWNAYHTSTKGSQRIRLTPIDELKVIVARDMLAPESGLTDEEKARLRTLVPAATQSAAPGPAPQK